MGTKLHGDHRGGKRGACTPSLGGRASAAPWAVGHALPRGAEGQAPREALRSPGGG